MRAFLGFETVNGLKWVRVLLGCNSWRQARVCMALARASDDPARKQYYEELALGFVQKARSEPDDITVAPFANLDSGNTNRHGR